MVEDAGKRYRLETNLVAIRLETRTRRIILSGARSRRVTEMTVAYVIHLHRRHSLFLEKQFVSSTRSNGLIPRRAAERDMHMQHDQGISLFTPGETCFDGVQ